MHSFDTRASLHSVHVLQECNFNAPLKLMLQFPKYIIILKSRGAIAQVIWAMGMGNTNNLRFHYSIIWSKFIFFTKISYTTPNIFLKITHLLCKSNFKNSFITIKIKVWKDKFMTYLLLVITLKCDDVLP